MEYLIDKEIKSGIYKITNIINNKYYIGSAYNLYKRFKEHKSALKNNRHHNTQLTRFINKYGLDKLKFELLEACDVLELEFKEQYYISTTKLIFNETLNVNSCNRGKQLSEEHKQNISKSIKNKNITRSDETKSKISIANKGRVGKYERTDEQKQILKDKVVNNLERNKKISDALKGRKVNWIQHSDKTKKKIGEKNKLNNCKQILQLDIENQLIKEWNSISEASTYYSYISNLASIRSSISCCLTGKTKTALKFKWKYKNE